MLNKLQKRVDDIGSCLCIGLDPDKDRAEGSFGLSILEFNMKTIDATLAYAACYKPQIAHYSAFGLERELEKTIAYIRQRAPDIPVILDAKRGDIGSTAEYYAKEAFERYAVDAVTVNPYLGIDSISPFLKYSEKSVIVLAKTSNPGSAAIQDILIQGEPLYLYSSRVVSESLGNPRNLMFVVGATDLTALRLMRSAFPQNWFLVPGIGTQGGKIEDTLHAVKSKGLLSISRGIFGNTSKNVDQFFAETEENCRRIAHSIKKG